MVIAEVETPRFAENEADKISYLEGSLKVVVEQILSNGNEYDLILGDDTSGRIPTLIVGKVLNVINKTKGKRSMPIRFASGNHVHDELPEILKRLPDKPKRVLIVTDHMYSGFTMSQFGFILETRQLPYDIACSHSSSDANTYKKNGFIANDTVIFFGEFGSSSPMIYDQIHLTGLHRQNQKDLRVNRDPQVRESMVKARAVVQATTQRLVTHFESLVT